MARDGILRSVVLPTAWYVLYVAALGYCLHRALAVSPLAPYTHGFGGGVGALVGTSVVTDLARRRSRRRTRDALPAVLTHAQRDEVLRAAGRGPVPQHPLVRTEALRLAEQRAGDRGSVLRGTALVLGVLAVGCAIGGTLSSDWWWGAAALLAAAAAWLLRRDRQLDGHLRVLRASTQLPPPPADGVHRLLGSEPVPDLEGSGRGLLELDVRRPWGGPGAGSALVRLDGAPVASSWGPNRYVVPAGSRRVSVAVEHLHEYGRATTAVVVAPGERAVLHYRPPTLTLLDGRIGPEPQRSRGARTTALVALALVLVLVVLVVVLR